MSVKKLLKSFFRIFNLDVHRIQSQSIPATFNGEVIEKHNTMLAGLSRLKRNTLAPSTIIDIGAASGSWFITAMGFWQNADYLLFEPLEERKTELEKLRTVYENIHIVYSAVGKEKGTVNFTVTDDLDGSGIYENISSPGTRKVAITTIDSEVQRLRLKPPYLIKFDTHGFEVPILEGAKAVLDKTEIIIMECYGFRLAQNSFLLHEMCAYLEELNFRLTDIVDVMRRPGDKFFWQCDLFFIRSTHPSFKNNFYQ